MVTLDFVHELLHTGRVRVGPVGDAPSDLSEAVRELDRAARLHLAGDPPALAPDAGEWALLWLFRACQALVYREIPADVVREVLSIPYPQGPCPEVCYSVDLALGFVPDVLKLARGVAEDDPLVERLLAISREWPLSSVGVGVGSSGVPFTPSPGTPGEGCGEGPLRCDDPKDPHPTLSRSIARGKVPALPANENADSP